MREHEIKSVKAVAHFPECNEIKEGIVYVLSDGTESKHKCPCGCGEIITLALGIGFNYLLTISDGHASFYPEIYSSQLKCKSRYRILDNKVLWCE